jgi:hypothetical protein
MKVEGSPKEHDISFDPSSKTVLTPNILAKEMDSITGGASSFSALTSPHHGE